MERSSPMEIPKMKEFPGFYKYKMSYERQKKAYPLLKKVLVDKEGRIFRATDNEISHALQTVDEKEVEDLKSLTGTQYILAVIEMFNIRG